MFILVFVVSFGPKKGTIVIYSDSWYQGFYQTFTSYSNYVSGAIFKKANSSVSTSSNLNGGLTTSTVVSR